MWQDWVQGHKVHLSIVKTLEAIGLKLCCCPQIQARAKMEALCIENLGNWQADVQNCSISAAKVCCDDVGHLACGTHIAMCESWNGFCPCQHVCV